MGEENVLKLDVERFKKDYYVQDAIQRLDTLSKLQRLVEQMKMRNKQTYRLILGDEKGEELWSLLRELDDKITEMKRNIREEARKRIIQIIGNEVLYQIGI